MPEQRDHYRYAEELVAAIGADARRKPELAAQVAVAEAVLAVADELAGLRGFLGLTMSLTPEARANLPKGVRRGGHHGI